MGPAAAGEKLKLGCFNEFSKAKLIPKVVMLLIIMGVTFENVKDNKFSFSNSWPWEWVIFSTPSYF